VEHGEIDLVLLLLGARDPQAHGQPGCESS
jgi:hypothetical protein